MQFPEKILSIHPTDKVLDVGPGANPLPRADVLLERIYENEGEFDAQVGYAGKLSTDKKTVYYTGDRFPFEDNEFDYIVCSHVLEHIEDVSGFLAEIVRVGKKGYFEFPTIYYEYLYNFDVHKTLLMMRDGVLFWMPKHEADMDRFLPVQKLFYKSLEKEYYTLAVELKEFFFQGFEWDNTIEFHRVSSIDGVCFDTDSIRIAHRNEFYKDVSEKSIPETKGKEPVSAAIKQSFWAAARRKLKSMMQNY